ncbi:MAG: glutathione peroxidase [Treponema sp.]|nr:glutathione peroxidase [Treponema sp.]
MTIYDFKVLRRDGSEFSLSELKGKVLLIVNTATGCGFTPQYKGLEELYQKYHDQGFEVLDFPCDQFGHQAPGEDEEIHEFCTMRYHTTFDQFKKIEVNGPNAIPLFTFLKEKQGFKGFSGIKGAVMKAVAAAKDPDYKNNSDIKWNFTKFLVDKEGNVVERFESTVEPKSIDDKVKSLLG